jgi:hypothetical protein
MLQNYNKVLTKRNVFSIILESNPDQDLHKKNPHFYTPQFFRGQNIKKSAQITGANTVNRPTKKL